MINQLYRVKPLEWVQIGGIWYARTSVVNFSVCPFTSKVNLSTWTESEFRECSGVENGKEIADAWHLERLLSILEPVDLPDIAT